MAKDRMRVAIVFGGRSAEHEISILSARNVLAALDRTRFEPLLVGIDREGRWLLQDEARLLASAGDPRRVAIEPGPPAALGAVPAAPGVPERGFDVVFPTLHGTLGEDGAMQGLLEVAGIPYVGAGVLGSAIGMDKDVMKRLLRDAGLPVAEFVTVRRARFEADPESVRAAVARLGWPVFTKPANAGSSVGVRRVRAPAELEPAIRHALEFDDKALVEAAVTGREIEFAVLDGTPPSVSGAGEIVVEHADGFYSYEAKYLDERGARLEAPARLEPDELARGQALAGRVFEVLECEGMARVDLFLTPHGEFLVNEINTLPGFTAISMYPRLWALAGVAPTELVSRLIDLAIARHRRRAALKREPAPG
ncbi:MAG: D-alanine--D-alanine ligase [Proteobacteria bacterium]|nr:D-alanine--D-alanine ligase [Pseudomonadota bacterium]